MFYRVKYPAAADTAPDILSKAMNFNKVASVYLAGSLPTDISMPK
jgi:hypothetical protein